MINLYQSIHSIFVHLLDFKSWFVASFVFKGSCEITEIIPLLCHSFCCFNALYKLELCLYAIKTFSLVSSSPSAPVIIAKGGRYDNLVKKFSSSDHNCFGIGFSISIDKARELLSSNEEIKSINEKVLIAYKQSASLYKALKQQKEWHNKGIISVISHEPLKTN